MKKILISAGGTREYIDDVRVLTNISSGALGAAIAKDFCDANYMEDTEALAEDKFWVEPGTRHMSDFIEELPETEFKVYYVHTKTAFKPRGKTLRMDTHMKYPMYESTNNRTIEYIEANSVQQVYDVMEKLIPEMDIVVHCMAVSDFTFNRDNPVKLKSSDADGFINYMRDNIVKAPKIITKIKEWNPDVFLVGFKFEVGLSEKELISLACDSKIVYDGDLVVANDKAMMVAAKEHIAFICKEKDNYYRVNGKPDIARAILRESTGKYRFK
jgi:phosphopantothenoylcysteine synthetase/decarboxylase